MTATRTVVVVGAESSRGAYSCVDVGIVNQNAATCASADPNHCACDSSPGFEGLVYKAMWLSAFCHDFPFPGVTS
jgi:hypothetical protein